LARIQKRMSGVPIRSGVRTRRSAQYACITSARSGVTPSMLCGAFETVAKSMSTDG